MNTRLGRLDLDGDGRLSAAEAERFVQAVLAATTVGFVGAALAPFASALSSAILQARAAEITTLGVTLGRADAPAQNALLRLHGYWVTAYGTRNVEPAIRTAAGEILSTALGRDAAADGLAAALGQTYTRGQAYWRLVASNAVTDARELARIGVYEAAGVERVYLSTVRDRRRSEVCAYLHGREALVADLVAYRAARLAARTPEETIALHPWWSDSDLPRLRALVEANGGAIPAELGAPAYHGHCRSRFVARPIP